MSLRILTVLSLVLEAVGLYILFAIDWKIALGVFLVAWGMNIRSGLE